MSNYRRKYKLYPKTWNKKCIRFAFLQVIIIEKKKEKKMEEKVTLVFIRNMESRVGFSRNEDTFDRHFGAPCICHFDFRLGSRFHRKGKGTRSSYSVTIL